MSISFMLEINRFFFGCEPARNTSSIFWHWQRIYRSLAFTLFHKMLRWTAQIYAHSARHSFISSSSLSWPFAALAASLEFSTMKTHKTLPKIASASLHILAMRRNKRRWSRLNFGEQFIWIFFFLRWRSILFAFYSQCLSIHEWFWF